MDGRFATIEDRSHQRVFNRRSLLDIGIQTNLRSIEIRLIESGIYLKRKICFLFQAFVRMAQSNSITTTKYQRRSLSGFCYALFKVSDLIHWLIFSSCTLHHTYTYHMHIYSIFMFVFSFRFFFCS